MKKNNVKKGIFTALLLASPFATAGTQYPAADFQPKVVYQDADYQHQESDSSGTSKTENASFGDKAKADTNYPAATFQPEVLFHDTEYKHKAGTGTSKSIPLAVWSETADEAIAEKYEESANSGEDANEDSSMNPLFAVLVLAVAGFLFRQKSQGSEKTKKVTAKPSGRRRATVKTKSSASANKSSSAGSSGNTDSLTGVAKYLHDKSPKITGVAKYLESNQSTKSGVAKYVAKKVVAAKQAASEKVTGVEKYLRDKG